MSVAVITPPEPFVDLALAKKHLRVEAANTDEDDLIELAIATACASIDGPGGWLERAVGSQTLELRLRGFNNLDWLWLGGSAWDGSWDDWSFWPFSQRIALPYPELISVVSITYEDASGADQVLTPTGWQASEEGLDPAFGTSWPSGRIAANAVRIRYEAGYAEVPSPLRSAVLLMAADLYTNREGQQIDQSKGVAVENPTLMALLGQYRVWR